MGDEHGNRCDELAADPRARWREMPERIDPESWIAEHDTEPLPGSVREAEDQRENREARHVIERGF